MCFICQGHAQNLISIDICTELREIPVIESLAEINCINNNNIVEIPKMPNLEYINIYSCTNLRKIGNKRLKTLVLVDTAVDIQELSSVESLQKLRILTITPMEVPNIPNLQSLDISGSFTKIYPIKTLENLTVSTESLQQIPYMHGLKILNIYCKGKIQLPEFPALEELNIYDTQFVNIPRSVKKLKLYRCSLTVIPKLTNLQTLEIISCKSITKKPLELPVFKKLLRLTIFKTSIKNIPVFPRLFYLRIRGLHVLPPKMPNLKRVLAF
jgi:hypothetical protein